MIARIGFWAAVAVVAFTYVGAPLLILVRARLRPRPVRSAPIEPTVAVVLAARNEAPHIEARLDNLVALDYPADRVEIVIASDGSEDRTVELARARAAAHPDRRITVLDPGRVGKADALNAAVAQVTSDIVVFTDANTAFRVDALRQIVQPFADPDVGGVAGNQVYLPADATANGDASGGERQYWDLDRALKEAESAAGSTVSATGAIYALRRELVPPVLAGVTDDFYVSTAVVAAGRRLVFAHEAVAYEPPAAAASLEYGRKVRIMTRGLRGVAARRALLDPRRHGFYSLQLLWHKLLRRLMVLPLAVIALTSVALASSAWLYAFVVLGEAAGLALAAAALLQPRGQLGRSRPAALAAFFTMINVASLHALWNLVTRRRIDRWEPARAGEVTELDAQP